MTDKTILLDADMLVHKATVSVEKDMKFEERYHILYSDIEDAKGLFVDKLHSITETVGTEEVLMCFSGAENWRKDYDPTYKSNRKSTRKPLAYYDVIDWVTENYPTKVVPKLEADDLLGILQTEDTIIWSGDKDLQQIPGLHVGEDEVYLLTPEDGHRFHMFQTLAGDPTDGYDGCPGIGKVGAEKLLTAGCKLVGVEHILKSGKNKGQPTIKWEEVPTDDLWEIVVSAYEKAGLDEAYALHQARLARILTKSDINSNWEPILWSPN